MGSLSDLFNLDGKVAIVTGGSRGLGLQIAEALCEFGAFTVIVSRKADELDQALAHLRALGGRCAAVATNLGDPEAPAELAEGVAAEHGRIDILINNAGATWGAPAEDYPLAGWTKVMDLNVNSLFLLTQAVARRSFLPRAAGAVVNIASVEGLQGHHPNHLGAIAYSTSKGAVVNMTRALAAEWGPRGVRVNAIAPGYFPSRMTRATLEEIGGDVLAQTPLGKLGGPDDLKGAVLLLASAAGGHMTGQVLVVDGGMTVI